MDDYQQYYSEKSLKAKLRQVAKSAGEKVIYHVLLLFYLMKDKNVPLGVKATITAALGYFIFPVDAIPDFLPAIGFTDDLTALTLAVSQISSNITPEIKIKAQQKLKMIFPTSNYPQTTL